METKPFSLQSPEQIAKDYGGNKQKIAEAMQMGIVDPTAGTLAAMFIDRMRGAAQAEAAPQQTVAQQLFAPPQMPMGAPPAGLGATPQAAAMPAPAAAPPMGMPTPEAAPPVEMSMGGLTSLPVPDSMFDEPSNGGYANGGLVAFARAGEVDVDKLDEEEAEAATGDIVASSRKVAKPTTKVLPGMRFAAPEILGGLKSGLLENFDLYGEAAPRETKRAAEYSQYLEGLLDPEAQKKRSDQDKYLAAAKGFFKMAQTPGSLLQAAAAGAEEALPGIATAVKERRGEEQATRQALLAEERAANKEVETRAGIALDMLKGYNTLEQAFQDANFNNTLTRLGIDADLAKARIMAGAGIREAMISAAASKEVANISFGGQRIQAARELRKSFRDSVPLNSELSNLLTSNPSEFARRENAYVREGLESLLPSYSGGSSGGSNTIKFDREGNPV